MLLLASATILIASPIILIRIGDHTHGLQVSMFCYFKSYSCRSNSSPTILFWFRVWFKIVRAAMSMTTDNIRYHTHAHYNISWILLIYLISYSRKEKYLQSYSSIRKHTHVIRYHTQVIHNHTHVFFSIAKRACEAGKLSRIILLSPISQIWFCVGSAEVLLWSWICCLCHTNQSYIIRQRNGQAGVYSNTIICVCVIGQFFGDVPGCVNWIFADIAKSTKATYQTSPLIQMLVVAISVLCIVPRMAWPSNAFDGKL